MRASSRRIGLVGNVLTKAAFVNMLPSELVDERISIECAKSLFARFVDQVEIENHSYCNRVCWFCPNSFLDRRSALHRMTDHVFETIIGDLAAIDYHGALTWSRYHEALAHESIFERVAAARKALPNTALVMISNGDYLTSTTLKQLDHAGLDRLMLDLYLPDGKERDPHVIETGLRKFRNRTGHDLKASGEHTFRVCGTRMKTTLDIPLYSNENVSTRGGLVEVPKLANYRRRAVCLAPLRHLVIDYNGKAMLCCQTRSDADQQQAIIGDLSESGYGLFHLYRDLGGPRRRLLAPGEKGGVCLSCDVRDDGPNRLARREWMAKTIQQLPGMSNGVAWLWRKFMRRSFVA